mgnify:CR=1 FL=1
MKYYVFALEQTLIDGEYNEYAPAVKKYNDYQSAETYFFTRLGEIANSTSHTFGMLKIVNSKGGLLKEDSTGEYVETSNN